MIQKHKDSAFTLVELIVVITIVGILSTVGFVSYSNYLTGARDSNRISQMIKLSDSLQVYAATKSLPLPDNKVDITASGTIIAYQGYAGNDVLETLDYTNGGIDPKDDSYFTYYVTKDRKNMQLLAFMEENQNISTNIPESYAIDYEERYPKVYGQKIGILTQSITNTPLQEISGVSGTFELRTNTGILLDAHFTNTETISASGYALYGLLMPRLGEKAPKDCPEGFIGVPGNIEFNTTGFCVAQYEMTYTDADIPNSCGPAFPAACDITYLDWNTVRYQPGKKIVSQAGKYPIVNITQPQSIESCKSMGDGYHLITNNEWMTIARNIESNAYNWSGNKVGVGNIWNGVSGNGTFGCNSTGGNTETRILGTKTGPGISSSCNARRSHKLTNASVIWDLAGNLYEHVNKANTLDGLNYNLGQTSFSGTSVGNDWDDDGKYGVDMQKYGSALGLGMSAGMGSVTYSQGRASNVFIRGMYASFGQFTGIYHLDLNVTAATFERSIGFRCAK